MAAKKPNELADGTTVGLSSECNTMMTTGMHLEDKPPLQNRLYEAARFFAQATDEAAKAYASSLFPEAFLCTHCNAWHAIHWDDLKKALFGPGGQLDFSAAHDELKGILNYKEAAEAGLGWNNGHNVNSDFNLSDAIKGTDDGSDSGTPAGANAGAGQ